MTTDDDEAALERKLENAEREQRVWERSGHAVNARGGTVRLTPLS